MSAPELISIAQQALDACGVPATGNDATGTSPAVRLMARTPTAWQH
jgi:hypothetical protein